MKMFKKIQGAYWTIWSEVNEKERVKIGVELIIAPNNK